MIDTYEQGYHKALLDAREWVESHKADLKNAKAFSAKRIPVILRALEEGHETLRKYGAFCGMKVDRDFKEATLMGYKENTHE